LISIGCKRIAHLKGPDTLTISKYRLQGYLDALKKHNMEIKEELIIQGGLTKEGGYQGTKELLNLPVPPDAIFAFSDPVAIGAILAIKESKYKIPEDIAIVGFSDEPITSLIDPSLSTISQPGFEMGKLATELFFEQINNSELFVPQRKILKTTLVVRNSSKRS
jgi:LacI family transcriptional regulator